MYCWISLSGVQEEVVSWELTNLGPETNLEILVSRWYLRPGDGDSLESKKLRIGALCLQGT